MRRLLSLSRSVVGKKVIMAVSGLILFLFVVGHLLGNLKVFEGAEKFNAYAEGLRTVGAPFFGRGQLLWIARIALLVSLVAHVWAALGVTLASRQARPVAPRFRRRRRRGDRGGLHHDPGRRARGGAAVTSALNARVPAGSLETKWTRHRSEIRLVAPANKPKHHILVVGSGLAGASAAASLAELGYGGSCFCFQDSPRPPRPIAAQGGINAAKNYQNDGDSIFRLFYDTLKGGDFRAREANVYRLAQISVNIIDQCVAQGVPFAREYGGLLANRSFGGVQVSRTFYAGGQTGQQLLLGAYQALSRQIGLSKVTMYPRSEMLDLVVFEGRARGIIVRDLVSGRVSAHGGDAVVLATGGGRKSHPISPTTRGGEETPDACGLTRRCATKAGVWAREVTVSTWTSAMRSPGSAAR